MESALKIITTAVVAVVLLSLLACSEGQPSPTPTPVPVERVEDVYADYQREKAANPTRLESRIDRKEVRAFQGTIDKIDGSKIQFVINERVGGKDEYVECDLEDSKRVLSINVGNLVTVAGKLDEAFPGGKLKDLGFKDNRAVKFKDCRLWDVH